MKLAIVMLSGWVLMGAGQIHVAYDEGRHDCLEHETEEWEVPCGSDNPGVNFFNRCMESKTTCAKWTDAKIECSKSALLETMSSGSLERVRHTAKVCDKRLNERWSWMMDKGGNTIECCDCGEGVITDCCKCSEVGECQPPDCTLTPAEPAHIKLLRETWEEME